MQSITGNTLLRVENSFHMQVQILQYIKKADFLKHFIKTDGLFSSNLKESIERVLDLHTKPNSWKKARQLKKRDLSPNRIIAQQKEYDTTKLHKMKLLIPLEDIK